MTLPVAAWRVTYTPGHWLVLAGPTMMVVMMPAPARASKLVNDLWADVVAAESVDGLLRLAGDVGLDAMPDFGAFFWDSNGLHGLTRGRVRVVDTETGEAVLVGDGAVTWQEAQFGGDRNLRIDLEPVNDDEVLQLPLVVGAASVSAIYLTTNAEALVRFPSYEQVGVLPKIPVLGVRPRRRPVPARSTPEEEPFDEPAPEEDPLEAVTDASLPTLNDSVEGAADVQVPVSIAPVAPIGVVAPPAPVPAPLAVPAPVPAFDPVAPVPEASPAAHGAHGSEPEHGVEPEPEPVADVPELAPEPQPEAIVEPVQENAPFSASSAPAVVNDSPEDVPEFPGLGDAFTSDPTPEPVLEPLHQAEAVPAPGQDLPLSQRSAPVVVPPVFGEVDLDDGGTIFSTGLAATHKPAAQSEQRQDPQVLAAPCANGHANAPGARTCRICRAPVDSSSPRLIRRPLLAGVHTNHGDFADVVEGVVVGRAPDSASGPTGAYLLRVPSPSSDISRNHLLVTTRDWGVHVTDLHSTNGTTIIPQGEAPFVLRDGASVQVELGTVLDLGDGVSLRIEPPRS